MRVVITEEETDWVAVFSGVLQGSVVGPLLLLICAEEIPDTIES